MRAHLDTVEGYLAQHARKLAREGLTRQCRQRDDVPRSVPPWPAAQA